MEERYSFVPPAGHFDKPNQIPKIRPVTIDYSAKNQHGKQRMADINCGAPRNYVGQKIVTARDLLSLKESKPVKLYAVVCTWYDADIIESVVKNCFNNGCERVYIVDNASPDNTIDIAIKAGAILYECYKTELYDDDLKGMIQNKCVKEITEKEKHQALWWLCLDGDEFPIGRNGEPIAETLSTIPDQVRILGSIFLDLYPQSPDEYIIGEHPAKCISMAYRRWGGPGFYGDICNHWKHNIIKYCNGIYDAYMARGAHTVLLPNPPDKNHIKLYELDETFFTFHAPIRRKDDAYKRLELLCKNGRDKWDREVTGSNGAVKRWKSIDNIFSHKWDQVELPHTAMYGRPVTGITLYPWKKLAPSLAKMFEAKIVEEPSNNKISLGVL